MTNFDLTGQPHAGNEANREVLSARLYDRAKYRRSTHDIHSSRADQPAQQVSDESDPPVEIEAHGHADEPWRQSFKEGNRQDRTLREITVRLPPTEAKPILLSVADMNAVLREIASLDEKQREHLASQGRGD